MSPDRTAKVGEFIRRHREQKGLSINGAARAAHLDPSTWLRVERGEFMLSPPKLQEVSRALEVAIEDLYALAGITMPEGLPDFGPYLRAKYDLPDKALEQLEEYFDLLRTKYEEEGGES